MFSNNASIIFVVVVVFLEIKKNIGNNIDTRIFLKILVQTIYSKIDDMSKCGNSILKSN
jgi:hypothetical protein